jgi:predicted dehydrogenase
MHMMDWKISNEGFPVLRVALVGYGLAGRVIHGPLLNSTSGMKVTAVVCSNSNRREQARHDFPDASLAFEAAEIWSAADDFELVVVASPSAAHFGHVKEGLRRGLHVVVDKPIAGNASEALQITQIANSFSRQVHTFHNRRWDSDFLTLKAILDRTELGNVRSLESRYESITGPSRTPWRDSPNLQDLGGVLLDLGSHLVDQAMHLLGPVVVVSAQLRSVRDPASAEDDARLTLTHLTGARSHLIASRASSTTGPRFRALCEGGEVHVHFTDSQEKALRRGEVPGDVGWGVESSSQLATFRPYGQDQSTLELIRPERGRWDVFYQAVRNSILTGGKAPVPLADVIETMRVLDAARLSSARGEPVDVRHQPEHRESHPPIIDDSANSPSSK